MIIRQFKILISKDYKITQIQYINVQQILVVTFEFSGAARGFMIILVRPALSKRLDSTAVDSDYIHVPVPPSSESSHKIIPVYVKFPSKIQVSEGIVQDPYTHSSPN